MPPLLLGKTALSPPENICLLFQSNPLLSKLSACSPKDINDNPLIFVSVTPCWIYKEPNTLPFSTGDVLPRRPHELPGNALKNSLPEEYPEGWSQPSQ